MTLIVFGDADYETESERLVFIVRLYKGTTLKEDTDDVGKSDGPPPTTGTKKALANSSESRG